MPKTVEKTASCLCGGVSMHIAEASTEVGACHCSMCRQWGGGPMMTTDCGTNVSIQGEENISIFDSSDWAERGFCTHCGSHLFFRLKATQQYFVPVGLLSSMDELVFDHQIYIDNKPAFYHFAENTKNLTEQEVLAMYPLPEE